MKTFEQLRKEQKESWTSYEDMEAIFMIGGLVLFVIIYGVVMYLMNNIDCKHLAWLPAKDVPAKCLMQTK